MKQEKSIRKPKQKRSMDTRDKILDAALKLFCEKGYYKTTTNEIAKVAGISIGSLYSYFKDKDTIFLEVLEGYNGLFKSVHDESAKNMEIYRQDRKKWLRLLIEGLIRVHESSRELNKEIKILSYSMPEVASISKKAQELSMQIVLDYFRLYGSDMKVSDMEAASIISFNIFSSTVDYIVFEKDGIDRERMIDGAVEAVYKYLLG